MIPEFKLLTQEESKLMIDAIPLITVLVAGADGHIDRNEKNWELRIAKIRTFSNPNELHEYYFSVGKNYIERVNSYIDDFPVDTSMRSKLIYDQLQKLNHIFSKLDQSYASPLYKSFLSFAKHVAKSSGGILGIGRVSRKEKKWITLPMLHPISSPGKQGIFNLHFA